MKYIGIVGSRKLPEKFRFHVRELVNYLLVKGCNINSGGAIGADSYAIAALLRAGQAGRGTIYSAWNYFSGFPYPAREQIREFLKKGGRIDWGTVLPDPTRAEAVAGLLRRNRKLAENSDALVAYLYGESRGTIYTIKEAIKKGIPIVVFVCNKEAKLFAIGGNWKLIKREGVFKRGYFLQLNSPALSFLATQGNKQLFDLSVNRVNLT